MFADDRQSQGESSIMPKYTEKASRRFLKIALVPVILILLGTGFQKPTDPLILGVADKNNAFGLKLLQWISRGPIWTD